MQRERKIFFRQTPLGLGLSGKGIVQKFATQNAYRYFIGKKPGEKPTTQIAIRKGKKLGRKLGDCYLAIESVNLDKRIYGGSHISVFVLISMFGIQRFSMKTIIEKHNIIFFVKKPLLNWSANFDHCFFQTDNLNYIHLNSGVTQTHSHINLLRKLTYPKICK